MSPPLDCWRVARVWNGWQVEEFDGLEWKRISIVFKSQAAADFYMWANAVVEYEKDNEDWKLG